jgi:hypothetical protein
MAHTEIKIFLAEAIKRYAFFLPSADYDVWKEFSFVCQPNPTPEVFASLR